MAYSGKRSQLEMQSVAQEFIKDNRLLFYAVCTCFACHA